VALLSGKEGACVVVHAVDIETPRARGEERRSDEHLTEEKEVLSILSKKKRGEKKKNRDRNSS